MALITLAEAKDHLRVVSDDDDSDVWLKAQAASDFIVDYLKDQADDTWDADSVPAPIKAAILMLLTDLHEFRGDDPRVRESGELPGPVRAMLSFYRDPALA